MAIIGTDTQVAELAVNYRALIEGIGEDPSREGLRDTPQRAARAWLELTQGYDISPAELLTTFEEDGSDQAIVLRDIQFYSLCEHHLLPFWGTVDVAYIPSTQIVGVSKLVRIVQCYARRLQIQERMTQQVLGAIVEHLEPQGALVVVRAQHLCMMMRGVKEPNCLMVTSALHGCLRTNAEARAECLSLMA